MARQHPGSHRQGLLRRQRGRQKSKHMEAKAIIWTIRVQAFQSSDCSSAACRSRMKNNLVNLLRTLRRMRPGLRTSNAVIMGPLICSNMFYSIECRTQVDFEALLLLDKDELKDFGLSLGSRKKLLKSLEPFRRYR